jgi:hypothetical protein
MDLLRRIVVRRRYGRGVAAFLAVLVLTGCTGRAHPDASQSATGMVAGALVRPASPEPTALTRTFAWNGGSFRYPRSWQLSRYDVASSFTILIALLSTERLHDPCIRTPNSVTCGSPLAKLGPGGVLITWSQTGMVGQRITQHPGETVTVDGRQARVAVGDATTGCSMLAGTAREVDAAVVMSSDSGQDELWEMTACAAEPNAQQAANEAVAMFDTVQFVTDAGK